MSFATAVFPDRYRCAGMALLPHTLGHALLLQRLGNPFAGRPQADAVSPRLGDVAQALLVCSRPHAEALRMIDTWRERVWLAVASWRVTRAGLARTGDELVAYLQAAWPTINWWQPAEGRSRRSGADLLHVLIDRQIRAGLTLQEALGVHLPVACWAAAIEAERNGAISIRGELDEEISRAYDRMKAAGRLPEPGTVIRRN
ncbi:MAG: hypothetical protein KF791_08330 [Verrucomicrobiae bacterium]|nr:hypothetical protein [Verrucomicrobiae bacterium]